MDTLPIPGDLGRGPNHQSTYPNIYTCMDRPKSAVKPVTRGVASTVQVSRPFVGKFWHVRNPLPQSIRLRLRVLLGRRSRVQFSPSALLSRPGRVKFTLDSIRWEKSNQRKYHPHATTAWWLSIRNVSTMIHTGAEIFSLKWNPLDFKFLSSLQGRAGTCFVLSLFFSWLVNNQHNPWTNVSQVPTNSPDERKSKFLRVGPQSRISSWVQPTGCVCY